MSKYTGPKLKIIRKLGNLPGLSRKKINKKNLPGEQGKKIKKFSEFAIRLQEKQKLRYNYGLSEKKLLNYIKEAKKIRGSTGISLLQLLEMRLDNILFRAGMGPTIVSTRQIVNHRHVLVNNRIVNIPSFKCKPGDIISIKNNDKSKNLIKNNLLSPGLLNIPPHLSVNKDNLVIKVNSIIDRTWVALEINELLVVEYYSKI
ncbi:ribosomal protein S4 (chloroplast) [Galdieria partita]|uniref:Small ribosomal subunit protein uS4c n=1 Tax=Galdieria partita TaxID=83374 RepID=A0A9C7EY27_9RHOD|nr:ribosomal protein S4 [Galdieria partita]